MAGIAENIASLLAHLSPFRRQQPIAGADAYVDFLAGRAAFVAQKKLFEYVKQRMGLTYPRHFQDDTFIASLEFARWKVYAACLSDLSLWMAGRLVAAGATAVEARRIAAESHAIVLAERFRDGRFDGDSDALQAEFEARAALADWSALASADFDAFERSSRELIRWAPIADELKRYDSHIVKNSLRYAWLDVRQQYREKLAPADALADWRARLAAGGAGSAAKAE